MSNSRNQCEINVITATEQFMQLKSDWNALVDREQYDITNTWEWLYSWWEVYNDNRELYIITFSINKSLVAIFPFQRVTDNRYQLGRKMIRFLGSGEDELDETCSEYIDLIIASEYRDIVMSEFMQFLQNKIPEWHTLLLTDIRSTSKSIQFLKQFRIPGMTVRLNESVHHAPYIDLPDTWDELLSITRINAREQLNRKHNLLTKQGDITFIKYQGSEITGSVYRRFIDLHQKRWESTDKPGCFASQLFKAFHGKLIDRFSNGKHAIMYFLNIDNKPIAARYCLEFNKVTYDYQTGLDPDISTKSSPGLILLAHVIKDRISNDNRKFDFFKGKKGSYKYKWTDKDQGLVTVMLQRTSIKNSLFGILDNLTNKIRLFRSFKGSTSA